MGKIISLQDRNAGKQVVQKPDFEEVYETYYGPVLSYLRRKVTNPQDAEDLASEAFIYCYHHYGEYDPEKSAVSTWVYLVVNSRLKNFYRDRRDYTDISALENVLPDDSTDMDRALYLEQLRKMLADAIGQLPERQQQIVALSYFKQKTSNEIADMLGMTPGSVRTQLSRALDKLESLCKAFRE